jgi:hypothetical protein
VAVAGEVRDGSRGEAKTLTHGGGGSYHAIEEWTWDHIGGNMLNAGI